MPLNPASMCDQFPVVFWEEGQRNEQIPVVEGATCVVADMICVVNGLVPEAEVLDNGGTCGEETVVTDSGESAPVETEK